MRRDQGSDGYARKCQKAGTFSDVSLPVADKPEKPSWNRMNSHFVSVVGDSVKPMLLDAVCKYIGIQIIQLLFCLRNIGYIQIIVSACSCIDELFKQKIGECSFRILILIPNSHSFVLDY